MLHALPTAVLHHQLPTDSHYDWLICPPTTDPLPEARLWTARLALPPAQWQPGQRLAITPIAPHRPMYLTYQGPVSHNRGQVCRVAQGQYIPTLWQPLTRSLTIHWTPTHDTPAWIDHVQIDLTPGQPTMILLGRE